MPYSVTFFPPLTTDDKALMTFMNNGVANNGTGTGTSPSTGIPTSVSPEDSTIIILNGVVAGPQYLRDTNGGIWSLTLKIGVTPPFGVANVSGITVGGGGAADGINQLLVRQGQVWCLISTGQWQYWNPAQGSLYNGTLPPAWTTTAGGGTTPNLPALAPLPTPSAIVPGSSGKVINCGSGQAIATLSAAIPTAQAGDKIQLSPGTYTDTPPAWTVPLLIDLGGAAFNANGKTASLARGKGLFVPAADSIIQNGTITNVAMDQTQGQMTSAIRPDSGCGYLTVNNIIAHNNQCAIGHGGFACVIAVNGGDISNNGLKPGTNTGALTHDLYVGPECRRLTLTNVAANGANEGHAIKYRGPELIVNNGTFGSAPGKPFDLPNGATVPFKIIATIIKTATDADHGILAVGEENQLNGMAGGSIAGVIMANCQNPSITTTGGTITVTATIVGNKITATGGGVVTGI